MNNFSIASNSQISSSIISSQLKSQNSAKAQNRKNFPQDRVSISSKAQNLSQKSDKLPLEAYSLPSWMGDLLTDHLTVDTKIGVRYCESKLEKYKNLSLKEKKKISEYNKGILNVFRQELESREIDTTKKYYNSVILNKNKSEEIHQSVLKRLRDDKQMSKLMKYFGKK